MTGTRHEGSKHLRQLVTLQALRSSCLATKIEVAPHVGSWHFSDLPAGIEDVRFSG